MIGKQNHSVDTEDNRLRIKLIANRRKILEKRSAQIQAEIRSCFGEIAEALQLREKQLLCQAEAIHRQQLSLAETLLDLPPLSIMLLKDSIDLKKQIYRFGNIATHDSNGIIIKDVEPYKVVDYQDANKDHVSFDKSITCQRNQDQPQNLRNIKDNISMNLKNSLFSSTAFSSLLVLKRKLDLMHLSLDQLHVSDEVYIRNNKFRSSKMSCKTETESCTLDTLTNEMIEADLQDLKNGISHRDNFDLIRWQKNSLEHSMQVQQWLQQILAETEIEPVIHEMRFSEISEAKLCNEI